VGIYQLSPAKTAFNTCIFIDTCYFSLANVL